jgi:hypothetical protein
MSAPGAPFVVEVVDGIRARTVVQRECPDLPSAAAAYGDLSASWDRWYMRILVYGDGYDYSTDGLESEEREAIESGDPEVARHTLREMGWE